MACPPQVIGDIWVGPQRVDGVQLSGQSGLGKHGVELPVTGGAEVYPRAEPSAPGTRRQVVGREPRGLAFAEAAEGRVLARLRGLGRGMGGQTWRYGVWRGTPCQHAQPLSVTSRKRHPGRSTCHASSSHNMGRIRPFMARPCSTSVVSSRIPKGKKAKACWSST